jgi:sugar phosphate isomerase/epimerase
MARPVILFSGNWTDLTLEQLVGQAAEWGYQGLELCCWGDHFQVQRAAAAEDYAAGILALLNRHDMTAPLVLAVHRVSQAICDPIDERHRALLPDYVWGDGQPEGVRERAVEELLASARAAQQLGVSILSGFTGSPIWSYVAGYPGPSPDLVDDALRSFARQWQPILNVCQECGLKYAFEVHPGQLAFDLYSAERVLDALDGREEFGFTFDPSHLHWQGIDPREFIRRFHDRIYHVHIKDVAIALDGRSGLLGSYLPQGDPRRGWEFRAPGHGGLDWEAIIRALNQIGYDGPLSVEWKDPAMNREQGAEEACRFVKRLDFEPAQRPDSQAFR